MDPFSRDVGRHLPSSSSLKCNVDIDNYSMNPHEIINLLHDANGMPLNAEPGEVLTRGTNVLAHFKNIDELSISSIHTILNRGLDIEIRCGNDPLVTIIEKKKSSDLTEFSTPEPQQKRPRLAHSLPNVDTDDHVFMKSIINSLVGWNASPVSCEIDVRITNKHRSYVIRASGFDVILVTELLDGVEGYISLYDQEVVMTVTKRIIV